MEKQIKPLLKPARVPAVSDENSLARYIRQVQSIPALSKNDEYAYADSWAKNHDKFSAEMLIASHLRMVVSMAYELKSYGIPVGDLIASGNLGLMQALQKFEPQKGFRFSTYATFWIRAEMYDTILNNWSLVKLGGNATRKKIFFNLSRVKRSLGITDLHLTDDQAVRIADRLEVPKRDVLNMSHLMQARDMSLNSNKYEDGGELIDFVEDKSTPIEQELEDHESEVKAKELVKRHLAKLPDREREILTLRHLSDSPATLEELGAKYGVSRERVRQLEKLAFAKLREGILKETGGKK